MTSAMIELQSTQASLSGLLAVLGEHLYSTPNVVVRELVQNAHDSCMRHRLEAPERAGAALAEESKDHPLPLTWADLAAAAGDEAAAAEHRARLRRYEAGEDDPESA